MKSLWVNITSHEQKMLLKALRGTQKVAEPELVDKLQKLIDKIIFSPNRRLCLTDNEYHYIKLALLDMLNGYLPVHWNNNEIEHALTKLAGTKYSNVSIQ